MVNTKYYCRAELRIVRSHLCYWCLEIWVKLVMHQPTVSASSEDHKRCLACRFFIGINIHLRIICVARGLNSRLNAKSRLDLGENDSLGCCSPRQFPGGLSEATFFEVIVPC